MSDAAAPDVESLVRQSWSLGREMQLPDLDVTLVAQGIDQHLVQTGDGSLAIRQWLSGANLTGRSVFMDTSTLVGVSALLSPYDPPISPMLLWDFATLATNIVCYDHVVFLKATKQAMSALPITLPFGIDEATLNQRFSENIFVPLVVPDEPPDSLDGVQAVLHQWWNSARRAIAELANYAGTATLGGEELESMSRAWSHALGRPVALSSLTAPYDVPDEPLDWDKRIGPSPLRADERTLIPSLLSASYSWREGVADGAMVYVSSSRNRAALPVMSNRLENHLNDLVIAELNHRAHFNLRAARVLGLPYGCGLSRLPYRRTHVARAMDVVEHLHSAVAADEAYGRLAERVRPMGSIRLTLPVFAAIAVSRATSPDDVWSHLAELRAKGKRYRERRAQLDEALEQGDAHTWQKLRGAVETEAKRLAEHYSPGQVGAGVEQAVPRIASATLGDIGDQLSIAHALIRTALPIDLIRDVHRRIFHPEYAFLMNVRRASVTMTNAMPAISRLWELDNDLAREELAARFDAFGQLDAG